MSGKVSEVIKHNTLSSGISSRAVHIELLRILACLMVIFNHTNNRGFYRYALETPGSAVWVIDTFFSIACKVGVPIFFMLSGANLLGKEESLKKTFGRALRMAVCLILWSFLYYYVTAIQGEENFVIKDVIHNMVSEGYWHLWYLYAYIAFIIVLPLLRKFVRTLEKKDYQYIILLGVILLGAVPIIETFFWSIRSDLKPSWIASNIFIYPVVGYFLDKIMDIRKLTPRFIVILWLINAMSFVVSEICEWRFLLRSAGDRNETFLTIFCLINGIVIFVTVRYICEKIRFGSVIRRILTETGKATFGIYLMHIFFLWYIPFIRKWWMAIEDMGHVGVYITVAAVFVICAVIAFILEKIPLIRKIV